MEDASAVAALVEVSSEAPTRADPTAALLRALLEGAQDDAIRRHDADTLQVQDVELLHLAAKFGRTEFVRHMVDSSVPVDAPILGTYGSLTALHHAVVRGQVETAELLIDRGADIESRTGTWGTALHRACAFDRVEVAALLIARGADLEALRCEGIEEPPLFTCIPNGSLELVQLLLDAGADPRARDAQGDTPADRAQTRGRPDLAELLRRAPR